MASYVTPQDIRDRLAPERLNSLLLLDDESTIDEERLQTVCDDATIEIDAYIGKITALPLQTVPEQLKLFAFRIARYNLLSYTKAPNLTAAKPDERDPWEIAYSKTIMFLEAVASGAQIIQGLVPAGTTTPKIIGVHSTPCKFTDRYFRRGHYDHH